MEKKRCCKLAHKPPLHTSNACSVTYKRFFRLTAFRLSVFCSGGRHSRRLTFRKVFRRVVAQPQSFCSCIYKTCKTCFNFCRKSFYYIKYCYRFGSFITCTFFPYIFRICQFKSFKAFITFIYFIKIRRTSSI